MGNAVYGVMTCDGEAYVFGTAGYSRVCRNSAPGKFVHVQMKPLLNNFWSDVRSWEFGVVTPYLPGWLRGRWTEYETKFIECVEGWGAEHILADAAIERIEDGFYCLKGCKVKELHGKAYVYLRDSIIECISGNACVLNAEGSTHIGEVSGTTILTAIRDQAMVGTVSGNAKVCCMQGMSAIGKLEGEAIVTLMQDNSTVMLQEENSRIFQMLGNAGIRDIVPAALAGVRYEAKEEVAADALVAQPVVAEYSEAELAFLERGRRALKGIR